MNQKRCMESTGSLLGPNEVLVADEIVTPEEQAVLVAWAGEKAKGGRLLESPADPGGLLTHYQSATGALTRFTQHGPGHAGEDGQEFVFVPRVEGQPRDPLPDAFWQVRARVVEWLRVGMLDEDPYKGCFLSYTTAGGRIHQHLDAKVRVDGEECDILRCNVLFRRPATGGMPVIRAAQLDILDRGMWAFFPTELVHSATEVGGPAPRGTLSFGFLVRPNDLWQRRYRLAAAICAEYGLDDDRSRRGHLIEQLRQAPAAAMLGSRRLELVEFIIRARGDFTVRAALDALGTPPSETGPALIELQRSGFVESISSGDAFRGNVMVL
jgi:hypothetical protein